MNCRHCKSSLNLAFADLESSPPSNAYLNRDQLNKVEKWFPLKVFVCEQCWLVQTNDFTAREELFTDTYAYFSSFSSSWMHHCKTYVDYVINRFNLNKNSLVSEIASNDGYLLQFFENALIPCFGVEPTQSTAKEAIKKNIKTFINFFGLNFAKELKENNYQSDLIVANNVLAHVPDINDFIAGFFVLLKDEGVATFEFPHLYQLVKHKQFDTIYHEHFSYLSLTALDTIFKHHGLMIFDVEELVTHGGSLRVYAQKIETGKWPCSTNVENMFNLERKNGINTTQFYLDFQKYINIIKNEFITFLLNAKKNNENVVGYGAAAKGNTLLNFAGVKNDLIHYVVDKNPWKQNKYLPGSHIPICDEAQLKIDKPAWIIIFPWNIKEEIINQLAYAKTWGARFVTFIPSLQVI